VPADRHFPPTSDAGPTRPTEPASHSGLSRADARRTAGLLLAVALLALLLVASVASGARNIPPGHVWHGLFHYTATGVATLADRYVDELSGGQRQRVWIAMALARQTPLLLLDEPTTHLDIQHQIDVLDLCADLHEQRGRTLVAVLHDLNQAARYATHLIAMRDGRIEAQGRPAEIITADLVEHVFGVRCRIVEDPESGTPLVVPTARRGHAGSTAGPAAAEAAVPEVTAANAAAARPGSSPAP